jgi:geranylgeranyl reductase family protein
MKKNYDVIIVGAGPAGCSAAYFTAKFGYDVLLVDKKKFPRDKACGDAIGPRSVKMLKKMKVHERFKPYNLKLIKGVLMTSPNYTKMRGKVSHIQYVIPRNIFDNVLLSYVKEHNIDVIEDYYVNGLIFNGNRISGIKGLDDSQTKCKIVIGADGVHSIVAKQAGLYKRNPYHEAVCVRAYFDGVQGLDDYIEIHWDSKLKPGFAWIFPVDDTSANVGLGLISSFIKDKEGNIRDLFKYFITENPYGRSKLENAKMVNSLKGWPIKFGSMAKNCCSDGAILIGDAACFVDPGSGEGIYQALKSGELAAEVVHCAFRKRDYSKETLKDYEDKWREEFGEDFKYGQIIKKLSAMPDFMLNYQIAKASKNNKLAHMLAGIICGEYPRKKLISWGLVSKLLF